MKHKKKRIIDDSGLPNNSGGDAAIAGVLMLAGLAVVVVVEFIWLVWMTLITHDVNRGIMAIGLGLIIVSGAYWFIKNIVME